jgi:hypothetical protein
LIKELKKAHSVLHLLRDLHTNLNGNALYPAFLMPS